MLGSLPLLLSVICIELSSCTFHAMVCVCFCVCHPLYRNVMLSSVQAYSLLALYSASFIRRCTHVTPTMRENANNNIVSRERTRLVYRRTLSCCYVFEHVTHDMLCYRWHQCETYRHRNIRLFHLNFGCSRFSFANILNTYILKPKYDIFIFKQNVHNYDY